jgi:hypothetical protein
MGGESGVDILAVADDEHNNQYLVAVYAADNAMIFNAVSP